MAATVGCVSSLDDLEDIVETNPQLKDSDNIRIHDTNETVEYCVGKPLKYTVPFDPDRPKPITTLEDSIPGTQTIFVKTWYVLYLCKVSILCCVQQLTES